ncbi:hypothetical protein ACP70R_007031 [Stipagrostis hirtigluma subsp. patula]
MTCLPAEMIELVLVRLPVSTLLRCRSVCKLWDGIIRDPQFIIAHLQCAPRCPLLFSHQESCSHKLYPGEAILFDEAWSPSRWNVPVIEPDDFLCASCNGLNLNDHYAFYHFGYHLVTREYKVIRFLGVRQTPAVSVNGIEVYKLGDDKWRYIRVPKAQRLDLIDYSGVVNVDGAMYWLTEHKESCWGHAVVSFDLNNESFKCLQLPTDDHVNCAHGDIDIYRITEIDGKLCVVKGQISRYADRGFVGRLQIWKLDNKVDQSWSMKYNIQLSSVDIFIPRPYVIHGDKILMYDHDRNMYYHKLMGQNTEIEQGKMVKLLNYSPRWNDNMLSFMHVNSLVRLDAYNRAGVVVRPNRRRGWELKKWEGWVQELCRLEDEWKRTYKSERLICERARAMGMDVTAQLQHPPKHRLNWVEQKRVREMLNASQERLVGILQVMTQVVDVTQSKKTNDRADQV